jgi:hypothetical protein
MRLHAELGLVITPAGLGRPSFAEEAGVICASSDKGFTLAKALGHAHLHLLRLEPWT